MSVNPAAFLSYAHRDDTHHGGAITELCKELSGAISVAIGEDFSIFQDRQDIAWGQHWPSRLEEGLEGGRFLIAILSSSFFKSDYCRKELNEFLEIERVAGRNDLILPIYFVKTPFLEDPTKRDGDPLAKAISERQYRDWRDLRHLPFDDYKVRRALDSLAEELVQALERTDAETSTSGTKDQAFPTPFAEQADNYETGGHEDPVVFAHQARNQGLMDQQVPFVSTLASRLPKPGIIFRDIDEPWCPEMMVVPPGSFVMGSPTNEEGHEKEEEPEHRVRIDSPFALGIYPVTFNQFDHFCVETGRRKPSDRGWGRGRRPVINVNVEDAEAYLAWLSKVTGKAYSLPSEAIWEYACRAGTTSPFSTGENITEKLANFARLHGDRTTKVGLFPANAFGLLDMHGNVWEWCADFWHETYDEAPADGEAWLEGGDSNKQVIRGGAWFNGRAGLRSALRRSTATDLRNIKTGFRCARSQE